ncbi:MAG: cytidine deaminase [Armatimonadetes bacterium]|nr:cytidine deaminase [Armatimonadota bacterium]
MSVEKAQIFAMIAMAIDAREKAYAPYSNFKAGAAVLTQSKVFSGCNVENASYGLTMCAERVAIQKAVAEGETKILAVVIAAGDDQIVRPCGACLQVIAEFAASGSIPIVTATVNGEYDIHSLDEYMPMRFELKE